MKFRSDINILRAVAVASVVFYHFFPAEIPGGFSGVDVFFVVSGFLMTSIIFSRIESGVFSVFEFYMDRARRIIPALAVLCVSLCVFGWFFILPSEYKMLGRHVVSSLLFLSNFSYFSESGYFDSASLSKWLLHTWSLSVEWQFYIFYPLFILALRRWLSVSSVVKVVVFLAIFSFVVSVFLSKNYPSFAYFMFPTRAWELVAGGIIFLVPVSLSQNIRSFIGYLGFLLIFISCFVFNQSTAWPGYGAILPVMGAAMVVLANRKDYLFLDNKIVGLIGKSSYSIYLWHWPVSVYIRTGDFSGYAPLVLGVVLSVVIGMGSYFVIEKYITRKVWGQSWERASYISRIFGVALGSGFAIVVVVGVLINKNDGFSTRFSSEIMSLAKITNVYEYFHYSQNLRVGICHSAPIDVVSRECVEKGEKTIFIWGDSYAAALYPGIKYVRDEMDPKYGIIQVTEGNGPPFFISERKTDDKKTLEEANQNRLALLERTKPDVVVISWYVLGANGISDKQDAAVALQDTISRIKKASEKTRIVVVGSTPNWSGGLLSVVMKYWKSNNRIPPSYLGEGLEKSVKSWDDYFKIIVPQLGASYVSIYDVLCNKEGCLTRLNGDVSDLPIVDFGHLSRDGSIYVVKKIKSSIFL